MDERTWKTENPRAIPASLRERLTDTVICGSLGDAWEVYYGGGTSLYVPQGLIIFRVMPQNAPFSREIQIEQRGELVP